MQRQMVLGLALSGVLATSGAGAQAVDRQDGIRSAAEVAFFVTLDRDGEDVVIADVGALRLFARCRRGRALEGDSVELLVRSRVDDWFLVEPGRSTGTEREAFDLVLLDRARAGTGVTSLSGFDGRGIALAPDGSFIAIGAGSTALGVNVLGHACVAVGTLQAIAGEPGPEFDEDDDGIFFGFRSGLPLEDDGFRFGIEID
jgi:hypothetical protein